MVRSRWYFLQVLTMDGEIRYVLKLKWQSISQEMMMIHLQRRELLCLIRLSIICAFASAEVALWITRNDESSFIGIAYMKIIPACHYRFTDTKTITFISVLLRSNAPRPDTYFHLLKLGLQTGRWDVLPVTRPYSNSFSCILLERPTYLCKLNYKVKSTTWKMLN